MFQQAVNTLRAAGIPNPEEAILTARPSAVAAYVEACWLARDPNLFVGLPPAPVQPPALQTPPLAFDDFRLRTMARPVLFDVPIANPPQAGAIYPHLSYAFMLEQSKLFSAFRRLLEMYVTGAIRINSWQTRNWIHTTEEVFFSSPRLPSIYNLQSDLRPDAERRRRNSYLRLLGFDLSHRPDVGPSDGYANIDGANREFAAVFEKLLEEVWKAFTNRRNAIGPDATDDASIADLLRRLYDMLTSQRLHGALAREEVEAVAMASWLRLSLEPTQIMNDAVAQGSGPAERLAKVAQRVGIRIHSRTDSFFQMAIPMSNILRGIESGAITGIPGAQSLYFLAGVNRNNMMTLINHWSVTTGRNLKDPSIRTPLLPAPSPAPSSVPQQVRMSPFDRAV